MAEETLRRALFKLKPFSVAEVSVASISSTPLDTGSGSRRQAEPRRSDDRYRMPSFRGGIHPLLRDGRDSSLSLRDMWFAPSQDIAILAAYRRDNVTRCRQQGRSVQRYLRYATKTFSAIPRELGGSATLSTYLRGSDAHLLRGAPALLAEHQGARRRTAP